MKFTIRFLMVVLAITGYNTLSLAQTTANFNFSAAPHSVTGWINLHGEPSTSVISATDTISHITVSSVATASWVPQTGSVCAYDGLGYGEYFTVGVMDDLWAQFYSVANYNAAVPQLKISGLNKDSFYIIRMSSSYNYGFNTTAVQYTVAGLYTAPSQYLNASHNVTMGITFLHVAPDTAGVIRVYVNTGGVDDAAIISGLQILSGSTTVNIPTVAITSPANNDILAEESNITINATATESGSTITKVEFYADTTKIGEDDTAPYLMTWINPNEGHYAITAKATDAVGTVNTASVNISVESLSSFWSVTGNIAANADSNFLGTVDTNRLALRTNNIERVSILGDGTVGIGTKITDGYKLAVNGSAIFTKVRIRSYSTWPDYVFKKDYRLRGIGDLEKYILRYQHLPGITPAVDVKDQGMDLGDEQAILLKKIEELTLYVIDEHKRVEKLAGQVRKLKAQNIRLKAEMVNKR